jgi:flagellar motor protein MotB
MTAQAVVWQVGDQLHITLPADTLFSGTQFQSDAFPLLQEVAAYLNTYYISQVKVMGFVDNPLGADQDQDLCLSRLRAQLVVNVLSSTDIDARLIFSQGFGHCEPLGDDATVIGRQINRRIEFIATKTGDRVRSCGNH